MAEKAHCCVFTRGEFFIRDAVGNCLDSVEDIACSNIGGSFKKLGNVQSGLIEVDGTVLGRENEYNLADPESRIDISSVRLTLTLSCGSSKNIRQALLGLAPESTDGSFVEDFCIGDALELDDFFPFKYKGVDLLTLNVYLRDDDSAVATLVKDTDYLVTSSGISIINDEIDLLGADYLRLAYSYDTAGYEDIEFMSAAPRYKEIYFKGINYGDGTEELFDANLYRVLFAPINQLDLITRDEFLNINLAGTVEKFSGKWFNIKKQES